MRWLGSLVSTGDEFSKYAQRIRGERFHPPPAAAFAHTGAVTSNLFKEVALDWIWDAEGGFVDSPADRGGATNRGISLNFLRTLPDHDGDGFLDGDVDHDGDVDVDDIRKLTVDQAADVYYQHFWCPDKCDELPPAVAMCLFDGLVNHRPKTARMLVQRALGVTADGAIGEQTRAVARKANQRLFLTEYLSYRAKLFADIVRGNPSQAVFERGWYRRLFTLQVYILEVMS